MVRRTALGCAAAAVVLVVALTAAPRGRNRPAAGPRGVVAPIPLSAAGRLAHYEFNVPPESDECVAAVGVACYTPHQLQVAYDVGPLYARGITGAGVTIAVVACYGSPTIETDLRVFDAQFGLPDPPSIRTITPVGSLPPFDPSDAQMTGWAYETTLDVEYAHALAPDADILVVATPVAETAGVQGFPQIVAAEKYVVAHGLADIISQSFAAPESSFPSSDSILGLRSAFVAAAARHVTVLGAAGDTGAAAYQPGQAALTPGRVDSWPASDPLVTAVGGTWLQLADDGTRVAPDVVWDGPYGAGGGGISSVFSRPAFQDGVTDVVGTQRGTPDVAMSAAVDGGALVYTSYDAADTGWSVVGGTSEAAPLFAGLVALADEQAGYPLGALNPALYRMADRPDVGIVDVVDGDNGFAGVDGYPAGPGYDLASGLGTVDAATFVPALVAQAAA